MLTVVDKYVYGKVFGFEFGIKGSCLGKVGGCTGSSLVVGGKAGSYAS